MENFRRDFEKELKNLEIEECDEITTKLVGRKFRRKALKVHSDKTFKDDVDFQNLLNDYNNVMEALNKILEHEDGEMVEKTDIQNFFENHNFAKEFSKTWTVFVEKDKVKEWKIVMGKRFPGWRILQGNGTQYQTKINNGIVHTTLYDVSVPKMNIQGKHEYLREFVMDVLPDVYKDVCHEIPMLNQEKVEKLPLNARVKLNGETIFTCDVCDKKYVRKTAMKKHMQMKHGKSKDLSDAVIPKEISCLPLSFIIPTSTDVGSNANSEDENKDEDSGEYECSLEEIAEVMEEIGPERVENNWQCGECGKMFDHEDQLTVHIETHKEPPPQNTEVDILLMRICELEKEATKSEKEMDTLKRRHEQLKQKYEQVNKDNKEYSKNLFNALKENSDLKDKSTSDAETLADTLGVNQVLMEEIKVKDAIIEANEKIIGNKDKEVIVEIEEQDEEHTLWTNCTECKWKSIDATKLAGHMLKHTGQYSCSQCNMKFKEKTDVKNHIKSTHAVQQNETIFECLVCDKTFSSEPSMKQHNSTKHKMQTNLPIGHPERIKESNQRMKFGCVICGKSFALPNELEEHVEIHTRKETENGFLPSTSKITCRYFKRGYCSKGEQCRFNHEKPKTHFAPMCNRGQQCVYLARNSCNFFHPGIGVQKPIFKPEEQERKCRYGTQCWKIDTCIFAHENKGFQFKVRKNRPPMGVRNMETWMDY